MKFTTEVTITGAKQYNNVIDGVKHDFTKLFVMTELSDQSGVGQATVEYKWGTSDNYKKIQDKDFPFAAKASMEIVTTGTRQSTIVHDITPVSTPAPTPK